MEFCLYGGAFTKKLLLIPAMLFPYTFVLGLGLEEPFSNGDYALLGFVMLFFVLPMVCNIIFMIVSRKDDPRKLMLAALLVKLVHIPAYVMVFLFGVVAALMIFFTLPLILLFVIGDYVVLLISSSISVFAIAKNVKENKMLSLIALFCQFFFCADVISLFVLWRASKKAEQVISE